MSRSIARVPVFVTAFLLSTAFALATLLFTVPAAHAVETTTFSQKLSFALCVRSPELTEQISAALADGIVTEDLAVAGGRAYSTSEVGDYVAANI